MSEDWKQAWQPMIDAVGKDFSDGEETWGADDVEKGAIRRFLEPLEFDCALHYDPTVSKEYGYADMIAPYSSLMTWTLPPHWRPGMKTFTSAERNAQPAFNPLSGVQTDLAPETDGFFATDLEIDYLQPIVVGDRLRKAGNVLLSCIPKETRIGRGAFMVWELEVYNQNAELIARIRMGTYSYQTRSD